VTAVLAVALLFCAPIPPQTLLERALIWPESKPNATTAATAPPVSFFDYSTLVTLDATPRLSAPTVPPATNAEPPPVLTPIEVALNRLAELGATQWQLRTFGCLAWFESRNDPYAVSPTNDFGILQINRFFHAWRWAGRDIYDPVVNAEVAWDIFRESGFRAWTTAQMCGV